MPLPFCEEGRRNARPSNEIRTIRESMTRGSRDIGVEEVVRQFYRLQVQGSLLHPTGKESQHLGPLSPQMRGMAVGRTCRGISHFRVEIWSSFAVSTRYPAWKRSRCQKKLISYEEIQSCRVITAAPPLPKTVVVAHFLWLQAALVCLWFCINGLVNDNQKLNPAATHGGTHLPPRVCRAVH